MINKLALNVSLGLLALLMGNSQALFAQTASPSLEAFFNAEKLTQHDAVLVVDGNGDTVYQWRASSSMIPASLSKLATAHLAIEKWGLDHAFHTDFYRVGNQLWVKGYGDSYLVSEELDVLVSKLASLDISWVTSLHIDGSYFASESVPGRSRVNDPYNAPLSAVAANFNTVTLSKLGGVIQSAEPQTPLTPLALELGAKVKGLAKKAQRINLVNRENSQNNVAQLLLAKLGLSSLPISIDQVLPQGATLFYRHQNSRSVDDIVRGMLEYSNNFMANQLFLSLADSDECDSVSFASASSYAQQALADEFGWKGHALLEGSGLSRSNQLSAQQINQLLIPLAPNKRLLKKVKNKHADIHAKTGTLDGVRTFAGYIELSNKSYRFVFLFNRKVPWRYREQLLSRLVDELRSEVVQ